MSTFFIQLALMPPNGVCALLHGFLVNLPARHDKQGMKCVLDQLLKARSQVIEADPTRR
jgi:hypothetical protein